MIRRAWPLILLAALLACAWAAYSPGLAGGFLFDDFNNLDQLASPGPVDNWPAFWRYITSGSADPFGRPMAMLSFLLDARDWPADPAPFLRTNVLLHLLNGALLFALLRQLGRRLEGAGARTEAAALFGAGLWLLHPLFVSTTLYIVQREAMLAATFTLLGLLAWGHGRGLIAGAPRKGALWMIGGIGLGTLLAMLGKANGALLPLLAWVLEATVFSRGAGDDTRATRGLRLLVLVLPSLALLAWLLAWLPQWGTYPPDRPWTIGERVLTEPRVLLDYLRLLVAPRAMSTGLYNDHYAWSRDPWHPLSTLPALLAVLAMLAAGFGLRRRAPALAAAVLFFFAGHVMESTVLPLELYFEHRNYLPAMLLGWPLARALVHWRAPVAWRGLAAAILLALLAATTWQRASLWADQPRMAGLWAAMNPDSSRALAAQAQADLRANRPDLAMAILSTPWKHRPYDLQLALNYVSAACRAGAVSRGNVDLVASALQNATEGDQLVYRWLGEVLDAGCPGVDAGVVERWTRAALGNPRTAAMPGQQQVLRMLLGRILLRRGDATGAFAEFEHALDIQPTPQMAALQAALLAAAGHSADGLALLDHYDEIEPRHRPPAGQYMQRAHLWVLARQGYWPHEFAVLRRKMHEDLAARRAGNAP